MHVNLIMIGKTPSTKIILISSRTPSQLSVFILSLSLSRRVTVGLALTHTAAVCLNPCLVAQSPLCLLCALTQFLHALPVFVGVVCLLSLTSLWLGFRHTVSRSVPFSYQLPFLFPAVRVCHHNGVCLLSSDYQ